jgi:hypothetical protein
MSPVRVLKRTDPCDPFAIVLRAYDAAEPVVLQSARDADGATVAFYAERRRLTHKQVVGELLLMRQGAEARTLLWERLR